MTTLRGKALRFRQPRQFISSSSSRAIMRINLKNLRATWQFKPPPTCYEGLSNAIRILLRFLRKQDFIQIRPENLILDSAGHAIW